MLGVSRQIIIAIEKGKYDPSLRLAFKIARFISTKLLKFPDFISTCPVSLPFVTNSVDLLMLTRWSGDSKPAK